MKLNIQIELDIEEFRYDSTRLGRVLTVIGESALEQTGETEMTDVEIRALFSKPVKKVGWWNMAPRLIPAIGKPARS